MIDKETTENSDGWDCLSRWLGVIQSMLRKGRPPLGMSDADYATLHRQLLTQFEMPAAEGSSAVDPLRQTLHRSVRPWVHLDSLASCDKRILRMLEREVRTIRIRMMPRHHLQSQARRRATVAMVAFVLAAITIGIMGSNEHRMLAVSQVQDTWYYCEAVRAQMWLGIQQSTMNQRLIVLAGSIVLVGMFFLRDTRRS